MNRSHVRPFYTATKIALDALMTAAAFVLAYQLRIALPFPNNPIDVATFLSYMPMMMVQVLSVISLFYFNKLYHITRAMTRMDEAYNVFGAMSVATMMAVAISALTFKNSIFELDFPRVMILYAWFLGIVLVLLGREVHRRLWHRLRMRGFGRDRVLIVGSGEAAQTIVQKIQFSPYLGYELIGVVVGDQIAQPVAVAVSGGKEHGNGHGNGHHRAIDIPTTSITELGVSIIGYVDDLAEIVEEFRIDEVIIALPEGTDHREIVKVINKCQRGQIAIRIFPDLFEFVTTDVTIDDLGGLPMLNVRDIQLRGWKLSLKRSVDFMGASAGLVTLSPLMILFAIMIRLSSTGSVFFSQERMGLDGKPFRMIKFRTMIHNADADGPQWTTKNDPRRTKLGVWLREKNIDELPQLINVLLGEMSLVGPRPEQPHFVLEFQDSIPRYMERHREKSGMTGWAQVNGLRGDTSISERTNYDLWYVEHWSVWLDMKIIVRTILQTISGRANGA